MDRVQWTRLAANSVNAVSRTAKGVSDTSLAVDKPELSLGSGDELRMRAATNLDRALKMVWETRTTKFFSTVEIKAHINLLAATINDGLVAADRPQFRTWRVRYPGPVAPEEIAEAYDKFCLWLGRSLPRPMQISAAPVAAHAEQRLNRGIHPFADGCGRVSRVLGAWILLRTDHFPAFFPDSPTYYESMAKPEERWVADYLNRIPQP